MSHTFHAQKRQEKFFKLAKQQGYRSRAAFKLIQLNKKFNFLSNARAAIDLCAAPGGWLQILSKYMPVSSLIIGVDILPIKPLPNVIAFQEDITTQTCRAKLKKQLQGWQVDLVVHDGAPNVGGGSTWAKDAYVQNELVLHACKLACEFLSEGGTFLTKIFRSEDYMALTWVLKQFFKKVEVTKPVATREQSSEIFAVCTGYLAPKKIDPRIFDANYIFKLHREQHTTASGENKVLNVLTMKQSSRANRHGYEDDQSLVHNKIATASQFLGDIDPNKVLAYYNQIEWDDESTWAKTHPLTNDEITFLFNDLKVLSKGDFTRLIRWHKKLRAWKKTQDDIAAGIAGDLDIDDEILNLTPEQLLANQQAAEEAELDTLLQIREQHDKKLRKKVHEKKMKELNRLALNANNMAEPLADHDEDNYFRLSKIKTSEDLKLFKKSANDLSKAGIDLADFQEIISTKPQDVDSDFEEHQKQLELEQKEWEALSYDEQRAQQLDLLYSQYKERKKIQTKRDTKAANKLGPDGGVIIHDENEDMENKIDVDKLINKKKRSMNDDSDDDDSDDYDITSTTRKKSGDKSDKTVKEVEKYLQSTHQTSKLFKKGEKETNLDQASRWFAQDIFAEIDIDNSEERKLLTKHQKQMEKLRAERLAVLKRKQEYFESKQQEQEQNDTTTKPTGATKRKQPSQGHEFDLNDFQGDKASKSIQKRQLHTMTDSEDDGDDNDDADDESDNFYNSSDEFTETDSESEDEASQPYSAKSRWAGTLEDRERDIQKKIEMQQKAEEYLFKQQQEQNKDIEVVPQQEEWTEYSDDSDARAEVLALGAKMIRKKSKNALIESTYNKYAWNDREQLPEWFAEEESQHNVPQVPITKAEVMAVKNYLKAIDARPMSKVAEAKGRKKRGEMRRQERAKMHADNILNQEGVSTEQKMKQLEKLQSKKNKKQKITKQYVMAQRNGKTTAAKISKDAKGKVWTVRVDSRMKKDKQGAARSEWRKKHGTRKKK